MILADCEVGSEVTFRYGSYLIRGIVCNQNSYYTSSQTRTLIGYKTIPNHSQYWEDNSNSLDATCLSNYGCVAGWLFLEDTKVDSCVNGTMRNVKKPIPTGMRCSGPCKDFNQWAEPNMPDGTYKCYGCRKH